MADKIQTKLTLSVDQLQYLLQVINDGPMPDTKNAVIKGSLLTKFAAVLERTGEDKDGE